MDALEYSAAFFQKVEETCYNTDNQAVARECVRILNEVADMIEKTGGQLYHAADVHDTGECCCPYDNGSPSSPLTNFISATREVPTEEITVSASTKKFGPFTFILIDLRHGRPHLAEMPTRDAIIWACSHCMELEPDSFVTLDLTEDEYNQYLNDKLTAI